MSIGVAHELTAKAEDCFIVSTPEEGTCTFGIFDGHNGSTAAVHCRDVMCRKIVAQGPPYTLSKLSDAFWEADRALGLGGTTDGTTASVLLVDRSGDLASFLCTLAWVGDSTVVRLDMVSKKVLFKTTSHNIYNPSEVARTELNWSVRQHITAQRGGVAGSGLAQHVDRSIDLDGGKLHATVAEMAPTEQEISAAVAMLGLEAKLQQSTFDVSLLHKALVRELLIELPERRRWLQRVNSSLVARSSATPNRVCGGVLRRLSDADKLAISKLAHQDSVAVLREIEDSWNLRKCGEVTTSVSRSIGDWDAARVLVPQPDVLTFTLEQGGWERVILASDGLWDHCTLSDATEAAGSSASAQQAADRLVRRVANLKAPGRSGRLLKDDVTVVVVDLNLTGKPARRMGSLGTAVRSGCVSSCIVQ
jgi:serine/threonine protein phosphatase PrpC